MEFEIVRLVDGLGRVSTGSITWDPNGCWNFQTDSPEVEQALRQVHEDKGVWKMVSLYGEGIIGDGMEFVPVGDPDFIMHLEDHLSDHGVLELRGKGH